MIIFPDLEGIETALRAVGVVNTLHDGRILQVDPEFEDDEVLEKVRVLHRTLRGLFYEE